MCPPCSLLLYNGCAYALVGNDGVLVQGTLGQEQVVSAEIDLEKLRRYREEGIPPMLKDRRPEFYRRFLYTEAEDRDATP